MSSWWRQRTSLVVLGTWTLLGFLESSKAYVSDQLQGIPRGWGPALVGNMPWWWCWALLTPVVFRLSASVRLDRPTWPLALLFHVVTATALSLAHLAAVGVLYWHTITRPVLPFLAPLARQRVGTPLGQVEVFLSGYLVVDVMTYGTIVIAWYALQFHREMRERERSALRLETRAAALEAQMHEARLSALRMELNPHFLFNTLNAIAGLVRRQEETRAVEMLARLGALLRLTLEREAGHEVALGRELELLELYLDIERIRFSDRLKVDIDVPSVAATALVPIFVLQPLVENAIRHGIAKLPEAGWIRIAGKLEGTTLIIEIADTGPGLAEESSRGEGVGLRNTRARLSQLYGASAELRLERGATGGTIATLELPLRFGSDERHSHESTAVHALA
jgi:two-component system LytT family sensor kinase